MTTRRVHWKWLLPIWLIVAGLAEATTYPLPPDGQSLVGELQETHVQAGETLSDIARRYSVGLDELKDANPGVDPWLPSAGQRVVIPTQHLLPAGPREGIVVNLPELRLYYYPPAQPGVPRVVITYPLGIGAEGRAIPVAVTRIIEKKIDPPWVVPDSIITEHKADGDPIPKVVPPGPDNPLGKYALRLGLPSFLIHSTNHPFSVGMRISHGCLRMYPENIEELFGKVAVGTTVRIVNEPYKAGWQADVLYLEAHPPMAETGDAPTSNLTPMVTTIADVVSGRLDDPAWQAAARVATQGAGIPTPIFVRSSVMADDNVQRQAQLSKQRWMVQVGVFQSPRGVERVTHMMQRLALPVTANAGAGSRPCRVLVGPFDSRAAAADTGNKILKDTGLQSYLVPADRDYSTTCRPDNN
jgi:L,D-transpeptidase ErfK/SrfK